jgi:hypothetical protein
MPKTKIGNKRKKEESLGHINSFVLGQSIYLSAPNGSIIMTVTAINIDKKNSEIELVMSGKSNCIY